MGTHIKTTDEEHRAKLREIVNRSRAVMLLSHGENHAIDGRPMSVVQQDDDGTIYLVTSVDSKKVDELSKQSKGSLSIANGDAFALIYADIRVSQDRGLIDELWRDSWKIWFPDGKADTTIALLVAHPIEATYWEQDLRKGLSYFYRAMKARLTGQELEVKPGDEEKIDFRR
jgi:general stress protein 26